MSAVDDERRLGELAGRIRPGAVVARVRTHLTDAAQRANGLVDRPDGGTDIHDSTGRRVASIDRPDGQLPVMHLHSQSGLDVFATRAAGARTTVTRRTG